MVIQSFQLPELDYLFQLLNFNGYDIGFDTIHALQTIELLYRRTFIKFERFHLKFLVNSNWQSIEVWKIQCHII